MEIYTGIIIIGGIYCVLLFFDVFFKSCAHYPYVKLLDGLGLSIHFLTIKWKTKAFNRTLIRWGSNRPQFLKQWFDVGVYASLALLPISACLLLYSFIHNVFSESTEKVVIIEAVVPGVNLPLTELGYYGLTLLICSILHEIGHALAAILEDVNLIDVGCNIFFILPVAYVNISTEKFGSINQRRTLNILCAGVWHNIVLTFIAFLIYCLLPYLFSPLYYTGTGVSVSQLTKISPLQGTRGLNVGDIIVKINDCEVYNENTWYDCLKKVEIEKPAYCIHPDSIHNFDESVPLVHLDNGYVECCDNKNTKNLCFEYLDVSNGVLELPSHVCLPARMVVEESNNFCTLSPHICSDKLYCFRPILLNNTNLFKITCKNKTVVYLGFANDIYWTVEVSSYISKGVLQSTKLPDIITKLLKYIIVISLGLAFLNILPLMYMDGQHITQVLGYILLRKHFGKSTTEAIVSGIIWFSTVSMGVYFIYSVLRML